MHRMTQKQLNALNAQLFYAAGHDDIEVVKKAIEDGANVNCMERESEATPLHMAAWYNQTLIAKILIEKGAKVNAKTLRGYTPLYLANLYNKTETAELLKQHGGV